MSSIVDFKLHIDQDTYSAEEVLRTSFREHFLNTEVVYDSEFLQHIKTALRFPPDTETRCSFVPAHERGEYDKAVSTAQKQILSGHQTLSLILYFGRFGLGLEIPFRDAPKTQGDKTRKVVLLGRARIDEKILYLSIEHEWTKESDRIRRQIRLRTRPMRPRHDPFSVVTLEE